MRKTLAICICLWFITLCVQLITLQNVNVQHVSTNIINVNEKPVSQKELAKVKKYVTNTIVPKHLTKLINKINSKNEKLIDLDNFTYILNSPVCENEEDLPVIAIIISAPNNYRQRQTIRDTWGAPTDYLKHVFLLGETNEDLFEEILREYKLHGDIVQGNFIDSYRNLTYKHVMGLKWTSRYCPNAKFILKTDDDVFLHLYELKELVKTRLSKDKDLISCLIQRNMSVVRDVSSKWFLSEQEFAGSRFPWCCSVSSVPRDLVLATVPKYWKLEPPLEHGSLIVYSPEVVDRLVTASENERYLFVDDVYVTGILREKLKINLTQLRDLFLKRQSLDVVLQKGIQHYGRFLFGPWNVNVKEIMMLWNVTEEFRKLQEKN